VPNLDPRDEPQDGLSTPLLLDDRDYGTADWRRGNLDLCRRWIKSDWVPLSNAIRTANLIDYLAALRAGCSVHAEAHLRFQDLLNRVPLDTVINDVSLLREKLRSKRFDLPTYFEWLARNASPYRCNLESSVPIPRFPWFVLPTLDNWYRTTINPAVWEICPTRAIGGISEHVMLPLEMERSGYLCDASHWSSGFPVPTPAVDPIDLRHRPDALLHPEVAEVLFRMITSGHIRDRKRAAEMLAGMTIRFEGTNVMSTHERVRTDPDSLDLQSDRSFIEVVIKNPSRRRIGREEFGQVLAAQLIVWLGRVLHVGRLSRGEICRRASKICGCSVDSAQKHWRVFDDYREFFGERPELREECVRMYGQAASRFEVAALRTIGDAVTWVRSKAI